MSKTEKQSLPLVKGLCSPKKKAFFNGMSVPWEVNGYLEDFAIAKSSGGIFDLSDHVVIQIEGKEAQDYLQRMTTVQFKSLNFNTTVHGAFLTGRGGVIALGVFRKVRAETFQFLILESLKERVLEHIEQFHFAEQFLVKDLSDEITIFGCWSENGVLALELGVDSTLPSLQVQSVIWQGCNFYSWKDVRRDSLFWVEIKSSEATEFIEKGLKKGHQLLGRRLFEFFRLQAAVPSAGIELNEKDIILEGDFNEAVARNKGCYPGQEVVERIFTYGQVNRKLQRVTLWGEALKTSLLPLSFLLNGKEVGELVSFEKSPSEPEMAVGLMFVRKEFWESKDIWTTPEGLQAKLAV